MSKSLTCVPVFPPVGVLEVDGTDDANRASCVSNIVSASNINRPWSDCPGCLGEANAEPDRICKGAGDADADARLCARGPSSSRVGRSTLWIVRAVRPLNTSSLPCALLCRLGSSSMRLDMSLDHRATRRFGLSGVLPFVFVLASRSVDARPGLCTRGLTLSLNVPGEPVGEGLPLPVNV